MSSYKEKPGVGGVKLGGKLMEELLGSRVPELADNLIGKEWLKLGRKRWVWVFNAGCPKSL